jgi:hypothetical protein
MWITRATWRSSRPERAKTKRGSLSGCLRFSPLHARRTHANLCRAGRVAVMLVAPPTLVASVRGRASGSRTDDTDRRPDHRRDRYRSSANCSHPMRRSSPRRPISLPPGPVGRGAVAVALAGAPCGWRPGGICPGCPGLGKDANRPGPPGASLQAVAAGSNPGIRSDSRLFFPWRLVSFIHECPSGEPPRNRPPVPHSGSAGRPWRGQRRADPPWYIRPEQVASSAGAPGRVRRWPMPASRRLTATVRRGR